jgi:DNA repair protein RadC
MLPNVEFEEWPRERLLRSGVESLTDAELVALVLRTGARGRSAVELGRALLLRHRGLSGLAAASVTELSAFSGVGRVRASALHAAVALGRRADALRLPTRSPISGSEDIYRHFHDRLSALDQERFYVVLVDGKGRMQKDVRVSEGTLTASLVHPREVFRCAIRDAAASLILVHNHPSGDPTPSPEDLALTDRLVEAGRLVGVPVLDHIVIGAGCWVSFVDTDRMPAVSMACRVLPPR